MRFLRLVAEGRNSAGGWPLCLAALEVYGAVAGRADDPHLADMLVPR